jgi:DNA-binding NarL/FixJ family response regulator
MKILLADDHAMMRSGLKLLLAEAFKDTTFGEADDCRKALALALAEPWDLIILDISMPGRGGLDVLKEIHSQHPKTPVLMISMYAEHQFALRAFRAGAVGYLTKASAGAELIRAVQHILTGGRYVSTQLAEQLATMLSNTGGTKLHERLSAREFEILRLIASEKSIKEIAMELSLSANTISTYRIRILEKMQMHTNAELTQYAMRHQLVE